MEVKNRAGFLNKDPKSRKSRFPQVHARRLGKSGSSGFWGPNLKIRLYF